MPITDPIFETWTYKGTRFIGFKSPGNPNVHILDEHGNNYGGWMSVARFRSQQPVANSLATCPVSSTLYQLMPCAQPG